MPSRADQILGRTAIALKVASARQVEEGVRISEGKERAGAPTSLDRVLFERGVLSPSAVWRIQAHARLRVSSCSDCQVKLNLFFRPPGSSLDCPRCGAMVEVPGNDPAAPFRVARLDSEVDRGGRREVSAEQRSPVRSSSTPDGAGSITIGFLAWIGVMALLADGAVRALLAETSLGTPAIVGASIALLAGILPVRRGGQYFFAGGLGLAFLTGLILWASLTGSPFSQEFTPLGISAHQFVSPLILLHLVLVFFAGAAFLRVLPGPLTMVPVACALYGLLFFAYRCLPGSDLAAFFTSPPVFDGLPHAMLHPGAMTLLGFFPVAAIVLLISGLGRASFGRPRTLMRSIGVIAGAFLIFVFGLAVALEQGKIEIDRWPVVERTVEDALAEIPVAGWWSQGPIETVPAGDRLADDSTPASEPATESPREPAGSPSEAIQDRKHSEDAAAGH